MPKGSMAGRGSKKIGRMSRKPAHTRYTNSNRYQYNKIRKLKKHLRTLEKKGLRHKIKPDKIAAMALKELLQWK